MALEEQMPVGTGTPKHLVWKALGLCLGLADRRNLGDMCTYVQTASRKSRGLRGDLGFGRRPRMSCGKHREWGSLLLLCPAIVSCYG